MTSIFIKTCAFLHNSGFRKSAARWPWFDIGGEGPLLVCSRRLLNCIAPHIEQMFRLIAKRNRDKATPAAVYILSSNAASYALSTESWFAVCDDKSVPNQRERLHIALSKLEQIRKLTLACSVNVQAAIELLTNLVGPQLVRLAPTLECLIVEASEPEWQRGFVRPEESISVMAPFLAKLRNLRELQLPTVPVELCRAIAAGPGVRLRKLTAIQADGLQELIAGCPWIVELHLSGAIRSHTVTCLPLMSRCSRNVPRCRYLQRLTVRNGLCFINPPRMQLWMSTMPYLTHLELEDHRWDLSGNMAAALTSTVGPQLCVLRLRAPNFAPAAFQTLCSVASLPNLEELRLTSLGDEDFLDYQGPNVPDFITRITNDSVGNVALSPTLVKLELSRFDLAPRILTQLLANKPSLQRLLLHNVKEGDAGAVRRASTENNEDWLGQLIQCPLRTLEFTGEFATALQRATIGCSPSLLSQRISQLARTLTCLKLSIVQWPEPHRKQREEFLGELFSKCTLLETIDLSASFLRSDVIDSSVVFAGLRNNERLRELRIQASLSSVDFLIDELVALRSNDVVWVGVVSGTFSSQLEKRHYARLKERFARLR